MTLRVVRPGMLTTVQDHGRTGLAHLGVPRAGALDRPAMDLANRLVGNPVGSAVLETTGDGVGLLAERDLLVAVTGAPCPVRLAGRQVAPGTAIRVPAGSEIEVGPPWWGLRSYLAVSGGVRVDPVLGSRSRDLLAGIGPAPLRVGDRLATGAIRPGAVLEVAGCWWSAPTPVVGLRIWPGPQAGWFDSATLGGLVGRSWTVATDSNRVGIRLAGPGLGQRAGPELPSEPMVLGAVQVPGSGEPVIFLADHPVTGGYPVPAVVRRADLARCAQLRPGDRVRFIP